MDAATEKRQGPDLRDSLAAERTFLAWIRTGLGLTGFGFVVARFGLFVQQLQFTQHRPSRPAFGLSVWFGTALIAVGVVVYLLSAWHHLRLVRDLNRGRPAPSRPSTQAILIALFLVVVGLAMAISLVSIRGSSIIHSENGEEGYMASATDSGIIDRSSNHTVEQTVDRLKTILQSKELPCLPWSTTAVKRKR
jgi:putative membrane protein